MSTIKNNINTYATQSAYDADTNKEYPNVSYIQGTDNVIWEKEEPTPPTPVAGPDLIVEGRSEELGTLMLQNRDGAAAPTFSNWFDSITMDGTELDLEEIDANIGEFNVPDGEHRFEFFVKKVNGAMPFTDLGCIVPNFIITSYIAGEGFTDITDIGGGAMFNIFAEGNVVLPSTLTHIGFNPNDPMSGIVECTSLTLKYNGVVSCENEVTVYDEETGEESLQTINTYPIYSRLYVPSNQVNAYTADNWQNVSPIV